MAALGMGFVQWTCGDKALPYYFILVIIGFFFGGCYNISGSAVAVDLA